ncbi:replication initiator protein A [Enterococcus sp.]|uniref:replication initiator protein A n=1 Tax=Enterococcus sp. TaxID=35783 RepID=UPI0028AFD4A4|nr:replication initiator protein A [Enterococcus sp.]
MKYENVYTVAEENSHRFYQLPKELFINESYKGLSISAKMIYSFLLDRKELSRTNNWIDEYGQVFLLFTRKHVGEMLNLSDKPVTNAFKELIKADLIKEERQGLNKPNKIYVCKINYGIGESTIQESEYIRPCFGCYRNAYEFRY